MDKSYYQGNQHSKRGRAYYHLEGGGRGTSFANTSLGKFLVFLGTAERTQLGTHAPGHCWHLISEETAVPRDNCLLSCSTQVAHLVPTALDSTVLWGPCVPSVNISSSRTALEMAKPN